MGKKSSFAKTYRSLTDIGREFNLSARKVGDELKRLGYRDPEGHPTSETLEAGIAVSTPLRNGKPYYRWHIKKIKKILAEVYAPDPDKDIRAVLADMQAVVASEGYQYGGGVAFKCAELELVDLLKKLPIENECERVLSVLENSQLTQAGKNELRILLGGV